MEGMTVKKLAQSADINLETIRYYEKIGLMPKPLRSESGYRIYSGSDKERLHFIKKAKYLGFTLNEIKELLNLRVDDDTSCDEVKSLAERKIDEVEHKIGELKKIKKALIALAGKCHSGGAEGKCPILENLEK